MEVTQRDATEPHLSGVRSEVPRERGEQGRLAGAVGADEGEKVSRLHPHVHVVEDAGAAEGHREAARLD
jgi:hypothetical protein